MGPDTRNPSSPFGEKGGPNGRSEEMLSDVHAAGIYLGYNFVEFRLASKPSVHDHGRRSLIPPEDVSEHFVRYVVNIAIVRFVQDSEDPESVSQGDSIQIATTDSPDVPASIFQNGLKRVRTHGTFLSRNGHSVRPSQFESPFALVA